MKTYPGTFFKIKNFGLPSRKTHRSFTKSTGTLFEVGNDHDGTNYVLTVRNRRGTARFLLPTDEIVPSEIQTIIGRYVEVSPCAIVVW